jgi:plastocyanin
MHRLPSTAGMAGLLAAGLLLLGCGGSAPAVSPGDLPAVLVQLAADDMAFDRSQLEVPADAPFAIEFDNREPVPHNVSIRGTSLSRATEILTGPATHTYVIGPLPAGTYRFVCDLHPEMGGTLEVSATGSTT